MLSPIDGVLEVLQCTAEELRVYAEMRLLEPRTLENELEVARADALADALDNLLRDVGNDHLG